MPLSWFLPVASFLTGLFFGSFFNVCIYRIPRRKSIIHPPSHCPGCRTPIRFYDNIPVLSYLLLRARCRACGQPISVRYPVVELLTGILFAVAAVRFGLSWEFLRAVLLIGFLIVLAFIDLDRRVIPDTVSLPGIMVGVLSSLLVPGEFLPQLRGLAPSLVGGAVGAGLVWAVGWLWLKVTRREGMGSGDIRLAALIGVFLGWQHVLFVLLLLGPVLGIVLGGGLALLSGRRVFGRHIPFGPFLAAGALVALFLGPTILGWWLGRR